MYMPSLCLCLWWVNWLGKLNSYKASIEYIPFTISYLKFQRLRPLFESGNRYIDLEAHGNTPVTHGCHHNDQTVSFQKTPIVIAKKANLAFSS